MIRTADITAMQRGLEAARRRGDDAEKRLSRARSAVGKLVEAKGAHDWTNEECAALVELCRALGVEIP